MGAQNFFREGSKITDTTKTQPFFVAPQAQTKISAFFRDVLEPILVCIASAEGASEHFSVFRTKEAYDTILSNSRGWGKCPFPPAGAHESDILDNFFRSQQLLQSAIIGVFGCRRTNMAISAIGFQLPGEGHLLVVATPPGTYGVISSTLNMAR